MRYVQGLYILLFCCLPFATTGEGETVSIQINIKNIQQVSGSLFIGLFNEAGEEHFPDNDKHMFRSKVVKVEAKNELVVFTGLPKGTYAFSLYQDENSNGEMDYTWYGYPEEPFAFSNNIKPMFSAPDFDDCSFNLDGTSYMQSISLLHY